MPTDYQKLSDDLSRFYDFTGKTVLFVGAAGRQLLDIRSPAKKLTLIDKEASAIRELKASISAQGLQDSVVAICADFEDVTSPADVVYFEFCLHEMDDPESALIHATSLAQDIVVYDHSPGSEWVFYCVEEDKVLRSTAAMQRFGIRRRETFQAQQQFSDHAELLAKISSQGPLAIERARRFRDTNRIVIPMSYALNLL